MHGLRHELYTVLEYFGRVYGKVAVQITGARDAGLTYACTRYVAFQEGWPFVRVEVELNTFMFRFALSSGLCRGLLRSWRGAAGYRSTKILTYNSNLAYL